MTFWDALKVCRGFLATVPVHEDNAEVVFVEHFSWLAHNLLSHVAIAPFFIATWIQVNLNDFAEGANIGTLGYLTWLIVYIEFGLIFGAISLLFEILLLPSSLLDSWVSMSGSGWIVI